MMDNNQKKLRLDKYHGALLGAVMGDALGWPNEQNSKKIGRSTPPDKELFQKWSRRCGGRFWAHEEEIGPGEYSDDTQLIIATARSLNYGSNWDNHFSRIEIPAWLSYERGGGGATKRAAEIWKKGEKPWKLEAKSLSYFNAGGNGVAMRILPHIFRNEGNINEVMYQVLLNGIFTHGHPRALLGATLYADALICLADHIGTLRYGELINLLIERKDIWSHFPKIGKLEEWFIDAETAMKGKFMDIWNTVVVEVIDLLNIAKEGLELGALDTGTYILEKIGCLDKRINGSGTVTAVASIYLSSKYASNPNIGLIEAAYLANSDTDTLASMVGGLLGMLHGTEWFSNAWLNVQDYEFLKMLIQNNGHPEKNALLTQIKLLDSTNPFFKSSLKDIKVGEKITALPFNTLTVLEKKFNKTNMKGIHIHTIKLKSEEGQTIYIKTFEKSLEKTLISPVERKTNKDINNGLVDFLFPQINKYPTDVNDIVSGKEHTKTHITERRPLSGTLPEKKQVIINVYKLRSLANILPENMPADQYLFLVSDIMREIERTQTGKLDEKTLSFLRERFKNFYIKNQHIEKIIKVLNQPV